MRHKKIVSTTLYVATIGFSIFLLLFVIACTWIGYEVKRTCQDAQREYGAERQDCVTALITLLNDDHQSFRSRNDAIWALGQLGDSRALSTLESFYTGTIPPREPLDKTISQYELKKAINLASGGTNITAFIWRKGFLISAE